MGFSVEGSLETYFEDFEFSLINAVDDTVEVPDVPISAIVKRINHKPFAYKFNINNNNEESVVASTRIYLCPRYDNNHVEFSVNEGRWHCIEMDKFWTELAPGVNTIVRKSSESSVTVPDSVSFEALIEKADAAVSAGQEASGMESFSRNCGIPDRLLLPKGNEQGLEFHFGLLLVMVHMITQSLLKLMVTMVVLMPTVESMVKNIQIFVPWAIHLIARSLIHVLLKISQTTNLHMSRFTTSLISLC